MLTQGEIADRISILEIKLEHFGDKVLPELVYLDSLWKGEHPNELNELRNLNRESWDCVERIYKDFSTEFGSDGWVLKDIKQAEESIKNYRRAHMLNMRRIEIKNRINQGTYKELKTWKPSTT